MKKSLLILLGVLVFQSAAYAEAVMGTVTRIDGNRVTLLRSDNQREVTVIVKDETAVGSVQSGEQVTVDANKGLFGGWRADTIQEEASVSTSPAVSVSDLTNTAGISTTTAVDTTGNIASSSIDATNSSSASGSDSGMSATSDASAGSTVSSTDSASTT